ncbi:MAG: N-acetylmuramoyl-L-alanine amidase [Bacteroidia bacterium]|nr:MAG: N-acetylmuramoyl-L-alanine amidase [Bacteroidia bacterium]
MEIRKNLLQGSNVKFEKSPSFGEEFKPGDLDTVIIHYTGGPARAAINSFKNPRLKVSAHIVVARDGTITQMVPFDRIAWHAGRSQYQGRKGFNKFSIGIEIENSGNLVKSGNVYRAWFGSAYDPSDVIEAVHRNENRARFWHVYTEEQIEIVREVCELLIDTYDLKHILGHEEISPSRKLDPGPAFPLDKLRNQVLSGDRDQDEAEDVRLLAAKVMVRKLNVRSSPDRRAKLAGPPLTHGSKVKILEEKDGWYKVETTNTGWVSGKYIQTLK